MGGCVVNGLEKWASSWTIIIIIALINANSTSAAARLIRAPQRQENDYEIGHSDI